MEPQQILSANGISGSTHPFSETNMPRFLVRVIFRRDQGCYRIHFQTHKGTKRGPLNPKFIQTLQSYIDTHLDKSRFVVTPLHDVLTVDVEARVLDLDYATIIDGLVTSVKDIGVTL